MLETKTSTVRFRAEGPCCKSLGQRLCAEQHYRLKAGVIATMYR